MAAERAKTVTILQVIVTSELEQTPEGLIAHCGEPILYGNTLSFVQIPAELSQTIHERLKYAAIQLLSKNMKEPDGYKAERVELTPTDVKAN